MEKQELTTRQKLLECGKIEFAQKGYQGASLRSICKAAGVTTGAFYFIFESKEALLCEILEPVIREWRGLLKRLTAKEKEKPDSALNNDLVLMEFEIRHKQELDILINHAKGSRYENFLQEMTAIMEAYYADFFEQELGHKTRPELIKILVKMWIQSNLDIANGDYDMETVILLTKLIGAYRDGGYRKLIIDMKEWL